MQKTIKSIRGILLTLVFAVGIFAAATPVQAAQPIITWYNAYLNMISETAVNVNVTVDNIEADFYAAVYPASSPRLTAGDEVKAALGAVGTCNHMNSPAGVTCGAYITGLSPGTDYVVYVVAEDSNVAGDFSNVLALPLRTWPNIVHTSVTFVAGIGGSLGLLASGTPPTTWEVSGAPAGVSINGNMLVVAPSVTAGTYHFMISVTTLTDPLSQDTKNFILTVTSAEGSNNGGIVVEDETNTGNGNAGGVVVEDKNNTGGGNTGGAGGATTTSVSPKTDDAAGMNSFLIFMLLLLAAGALYTGRKVIKTKK